MKVTIINPVIPFLCGSGSRFHLPYGPAILVSRLRREGISADISDLNIIIKKTLPRDKFRKIFHLLNRFYSLQLERSTYCGIEDKPNCMLAAELIRLSNIDTSTFVGISILSGTGLSISLLIAEYLHTHSRVPVVLGGSYVTLAADIFFSQYNFLPYAIIGDGETPLLKLLHALKHSTSLGAVPSLYYRVNNKTFFTGRRSSRIEDESPPDFRGLHLERYKESDGPLSIPYRTSRGCINNCSFCENSHLEGPWETKSLSKIIREIKSLKSEYGSDHFSLRDNNINTTYQCADDVCSAFISHNLRITWLAQAQFKNMDEKLLAKMRLAGCSFISWGLESASAHMRSLMNKPVGDIAPDKILQAARRERIYNRVYFIIGHPHESTADLKETAAFIKKNAAVINIVVIYRLSIRPHTQLFEQVTANGVRVAPSAFAFDLYHGYNHEPLKRQPVRIEKELKRLRSKIIDYNFRYVISRSVRFPANLVLFLFGRLVELPIVLLYRLLYFNACHEAPHLLQLRRIIAALPSASNRLPRVLKKLFSVLSELVHGFSDN